MYELYYWPGLPGRGEFIRLVLEQAGQPYRDVGPESGVEAVVAMRNTRAGFAPPFLKDEALVLAQVPAICYYLGQKHGLVPEDPAGSARVSQLFLSVMDVVTEVHDTHHPISVALAYEAQKTEAKHRASEFLSARLENWMGFFVETMTDNEWLVSNTLSISDLALFQLVEGLAYAFPNGSRQLVPVELKDHQQRVANLPGLADYLGSSRRQAFNENGIFRRYPELDLAD
jgi:glutathione S-transferase